MNIVGRSVSDSHHFDADPDPAFQFDAGPDPTFHSHADPDPTTQICSNAPK